MMSPIGRHLLIASSLVLTGCLEEADTWRDAYRNKRAMIAVAKASIQTVDTVELSDPLVAALVALEQDLDAYERSKIRLAAMVNGRLPDICDDDETMDRTACDLARIEPAAGPTEYRDGVTASDVRLREAPSRKAPVSALVEAGTPVQILHEDQDYYLVKVLGMSTSGYAFGDYISEVISKEAPLLQEPGAIEPGLEDRKETPEAVLVDSIRNFAAGVENEHAGFELPAFQCRSELEKCRRNDFGYIDCELTMLICLADVLVSN